MRRLNALTASLLFALLTIITLASTAAAQDPSKAVAVKGVISVDKVRQGSPFQGAIVLDINEAFHINSNKPLDANLIATTVELVKAEGVTFGPLNYPRGENQKFKFSEDPLSVYSGRTVIKFTARPTPKLALGAQTLKAKVRYQACNDQACFPPKTVEVAIPIEVVDGKAKVTPAHADIFAAKAAPKAAHKGKGK